MPTRPAKPDRPYFPLGTFTTHAAYFSDHPLPRQQLLSPTSWSAQSSQPQARGPARPLISNGTSQLSPSDTTTSEDRGSKSKRPVRRRQKAAQPSSSESEKRARHLEKNRLAAMKCRKKEKEWVESLTERYRDEIVRMHMLSSLEQSLQEELKLLKDEIDMHRGGTCLGGLQSQPPPGSSKTACGRGSRNDTFIQPYPGQVPPLHASPYVQQMQYV